MRARMITSMSGGDCDLPYGTVLSIGGEYAPSRLLLDRATADRWIAQGVLEVLAGDEPPASAPIETTMVETPVIALPKRGRLHGRRQ